VTIFSSLYCVGTLYIFLIDEVLGYGCTCLLATGCNYTGCAITGAGWYLTRYAFNIKLVC
jgi:hypothetical protein